MAAKGCVQRESAVDSNMRAVIVANQLLRMLPKSIIDKLSPALDILDIQAGDTLFEPGDDVAHTYFPLAAVVVALVLPMQDGQTVEAATIGREGAVGGVVSLGAKPAYARIVVQIPGQVARIRIQRLEQVKRVEPRLHAAMTRYADCLIAQILQSVGCAGVHTLEARTARWLLMTHDRLQKPELPLTQELLADMFGVARTYLTRVAQKLQRMGAITYRRGVIRIESRAVLEETTCECYALVRRHFDRVAPGLYPELGEE